MKDIEKIRWLLLSEEERARKATLTTKGCETRITKTSKLPYNSLRVISPRTAGGRTNGMEKID